MGESLDPSATISEVWRSQRPNGTRKRRRRAPSSRLPSPEIRTRSLGSSRATTTGMTRVAFLICGDLDLADDAVAAAWALAWRKLAGLRNPEKVRPWLVTIAANEARRLAASRRRRSVLEIEVTPLVEGVRFKDPGSRPGDIDLANALNRLGPGDRALLALRYVAGFDSFEIAEAMGKSASGTRARLARLLSRLRTELSDD